MSEIIPETPANFDEAEIIERPDGFYWTERETGRDFGPFATMVEAMEDMQYDADSNYEPGETLEEAEAEIGISDWIDPETGLPAEETHHLSE